MIQMYSRFKDLPVILMSGIIINLDNRARAVGANSYLMKPFTLADLKEKLLAFFPNFAAE